MSEKYLIMQPVISKLIPSYFLLTKTGRNEATIRVIEEVRAIANSKVSIILVFSFLSYSVSAGRTAD